MFIASGDVDAMFPIAVLDACELLLQVVIVILPDAVLIHPVLNEVLDRYVPDCSTGKILPHVHGKQIVDCLRYGKFARSGEVIVRFRFLGLRERDAYRQLIILLLFRDSIIRTQTQEVSDDIVDIGLRRELAWPAEMVLTPFDFIGR